MVNDRRCPPTMTTIRSVPKMIVGIGPSRIGDDEGRHGAHDEQGATGRLCSEEFMERTR